MNFAAVLGRQPRQIEHANQRSFDAADLARDFQQPPALRHLAGAGVLASRGAVDDQDAGRLVRIFMLALGLLHGLVNRSPVVSEVVVGVRELRAGLVRSRRLAVVGISIPGRARETVELSLQRSQTPGR